MTVLTNADLFRRGADTLVASWEEYSRGAVGAFLQRFPGVAVAAFPNKPERAVYNNALLVRDLPIAERADAVDAMEAAYAAAGVGRFAAWVHESDKAMRADLEQRGYTLDTSTRAMAMPLDEIRLPRPDVELAPANWLEHLRFAGVPPNFLLGADPDAYYILIARLGDENVATAMAFDHGSDCGIYNTGTVDHARRRGLATALTALHVHDALARGCQSASLQSTEMAERVYAAVGFRDLGRFLEYVPARRSRERDRTAAHARKLAKPTLARPSHACAARQRTAPPSPSSKLRSNFIAFMSLPIRRRGRGFHRATAAR